MNQNLIIPGSFYLRGAIAPNIGGPLIFEGFSHGVPIFAVIPTSAQVPTTEATNVLPYVANGAAYVNEYLGDGEVTYTLPTPDSAQQILISNSSSANPLLIQAPAGASIRWTDGTLHSAILSGGNGSDNITLIGESATVWRVTYAGQSGQSTWTPQ